jgi:hypothetical protein
MGEKFSPMTHSPSVLVCVDVYSTELTRNGEIHAPAYSPLFERNLVGGMLFDYNRNENWRHVKNNCCFRASVVRCSRIVGGVQ